MNIFKNCYTSEILKLTLLFCTFFLLCSDLLHAQISNIEAQKLFERSVSIQKTGMLVLGSWATINILTGIPGTIQSQGTRKYFHQMNTAWNTINLTIASLGFVGALNSDPTITVNEITKEIYSFDRILLINAGLDLMYIGIGGYLWKRGLIKDSHRLTGYGKSIVLQGSFLLLFDGFLYMIHHQQTNKISLLGTELSLNLSGFNVAF